MDAFKIVAFYFFAKLYKNSAKSCFLTVYYYHATYAFQSDLHSIVA